MDGVGLEFVIVLGVIVWESLSWVIPLGGGTLGFIAGILVFILGKTMLLEAAHY